jgi:hydroxymethylglutaryl-CoA lyase
MAIPSKVKIVDVGPRDGLQNEKQHIDAAIKIELVHRLQNAGLKEIEVTSFVSPKWVPQMADNAQVMAGITRQFDVRYSVLRSRASRMRLWCLPQPPKPLASAISTAALSKALSALLPWWPLRVRRACMCAAL